MSPTRREFLERTLGASLVLSLGPAAPSLLTRARAAADSQGDSNVLVVVQLSGGNDGLNTIVPFTDPAYRKARPTLGIPTAELLKVDDQNGFHPSLRGLADLLEQGQLAVVRGVGYPDPNRSHFESMDIWHTCRRKNVARADGWLGRFLDARVATAAGDAPAVHLGADKQPLALASRDVRVPSIASLDRFRLSDGVDRELRTAIDELSRVDRAAADDLLNFVQSSTTSALAASDRVEQSGAKYDSPVHYPDTELAQKLRTVAQLIDAGLKTRVYYVELAGFDTHSKQPGAHAALLGQLGGAVKAFMDDIAHHGHGDRVLLFSFSEFGRRVQENASDGTDHGAAGPVFLAGKRVRAGLIGDQPSLTDLQDGDLRFHTDFRQVYAALLQRWFACDSADILGGQYTPVDVISAARG